MITFKGTQKEFFKAYPKEKRSLKETYKLINSTGETLYKFIKTTGEKNFKKVSEKELTNETEKKDDSKVSSKIVEPKSTPKDNVQEKVNEKEEVTKTVIQQSVKTKEKIVSRKEEICNQLEDIFTYAIEKTKYDKEYEENRSPDSWNYHADKKCYHEQCESYLRAARICARNGWFRYVGYVTYHAISYAREHDICTYIRKEIDEIVQEIKDNNYFGSEDEDNRYFRTFENDCYCCDAMEQARLEMMKELILKEDLKKLKKYPAETNLKYFEAAVREIERCHERIEHLEVLLKQVEDIVKTRNNRPK